MNYEEKIALLDESDFISLFSKLGAEPRWVTSAGKRAIQIIGLCHHGENHSALFDPSTLKVHCFSECGGGMLFHTWIKQTLGMSAPQEAKDFIEDWIENQDLDLSNRVSKHTDFEYQERPYTPIVVDRVPGMPVEVLNELYAGFDTTLETLRRLTWCTEDLIFPEWLKKFDVAYDPATGSVILPHHNINGEIVGLYERSFKPLRKKVREEHPEMDYKKLLTYPRAKYVPKLRAETHQTEEKTSWSFPNSMNLYGLHLAVEGIQKHRKAIIFEGGKSVMLAHQYGYPYGVATHTFGAHLNHISMLIECGAEEIILAFDKQYEEESGQAWELYERKTRGLADKVKDFVKVTRLRDQRGDRLGFKDSPIDRGEDIFSEILAERDKDPIVRTAEDAARETLAAVRKAQREISETQMAELNFAMNLMNPYAK